MRALNNTAVWISSRSLSRTAIGSGVTEAQCSGPLEKDVILVESFYLTKYRENDTEQSHDLLG